jgi:hypothetical protein
MYTKSFSSVFGNEAIDESERTVSGYFTDGLVDEHGHIVDPSAMQKAVDEYRVWSNVRDMHGKPVGTALSIGEKAWNHIVVKIVDEGVWSLITGGVYKGFSIGAIVTAGKMVSVKELAEDKFAGVSNAMKNSIRKLGEVFVITELSLVEVSVVDRPANPRAVFSAKAIDGEDVVELPSVKAIAKSDSIKGVLLKSADAVVETEILSVGADGDGVNANQETEGVMDGENVAVEADATPANNAHTHDVVEDVEVVIDVEKSVDSVEVVADVVVEDVVDEEVVLSTKSADEDNVVATDNPVSMETFVELAAEVKNLSGMIERLLSAINEAKSVAAEVPVEPHVISDEQLEKLANVVSEKLVMERKSLVYGTGGTVEPEPQRVDVKGLAVKDLSDLIVNSIKNRATTK